MSVVNTVVSASRLCDPGQSLSIPGPLLPHPHSEKTGHSFLEGGPKNEMLPRKCWAQLLAHGMCLISSDYWVSTRPAHYYSEMGRRGENPSPDGHGLGMPTLLRGV